MNKNPKKILVTGGARYGGYGLSRELLSKGYVATYVDNLFYGGDSSLDILHYKDFTYLTICMGMLLQKIKKK